MEGLIGGVLGLMFWFGVGWLIRAGWAAVSAGAKSATGHGDFEEEFHRSLHGAPPLRFDLRQELVKGDQPFIAFRIFVKGKLPVDRTTELAFAASIFDITDVEGNDGTNMRPVLCTLDRYQEPNTICFQDVTAIGQVEPNQFLDDWVPVLSFIPETLVAPQRGHRRFRIFITAFDVQAPPTFHEGWFEGDVLTNEHIDFEWRTVIDGYEETARKMRRAEEIMVALAMSVARADGAVAEAETAVVTRWIAKRATLVRPEERVERVSVLRRLVDGDGSGNGSAPLDGQVEQLAAVSSPAVRLEALELCLDVLAADGDASTAEMAEVNRLAQRLEVDLDRFGALKDKRVASLRHALKSEADYHALLGIDPAWDRDRIRTHLNGLYSTWNGRAEALSDPEKRAQAERMLEIIAQARGELLD